MTDKPSSTRTPALIEERFQPVFFKNLIQLLEVPALRAEAAHAIGMLGTYGKSAAPALFKVLREKRDVSVILTALYYIDAPIDGEDAEIAQHLKNSDPRTASAACSLLAQRGDLAAKHRDLILPLLNDARGHCKQEANRALMAILIVSKKET
jgi:hypothetical protein